MEKDYLILKRASASRPSGEWNDEDYDVLCDVMQAAAVPVGMSWMWTLAFGYHEDRTPSHGYAATREAAMAAFAKSWEPSDQCRSGPESATRLKVTRISSGRRNRFHRRQLERRAGDQTPAALYDDREPWPRPVRSSRGHFPTTRSAGKSS